MKICFINGWVNGSTGNIIKDISFFLKEKRNASMCYIYREKSDISDYNVLQLRTSSLSYKSSRLYTYLVGNDGFCNTVGTKKAINFLKRERPDLIHINNVHSSFINIEKVIEFASKSNIKIVWTLHDEWLVTGRCCYSFGCELWKNGCVVCPHRDYYPTSIRKKVKKYSLKKENLIKNYSSNIVFVSPSQWLKNIFETRYNFTNVEIIRNGVDQKIFKRTAPYETLLKLADGRFIIGVAAYLLNEGKGLNFIKRLANALDPNKFIIIGFGAPENEIEKNNCPNLVLRPRISSRQKMASFYSTIDVFLNPTKRDNFPTVNLECISCGTPIICFNSGGAAEMIKDGINGYVVPTDDVENTKKKIYELVSNKMNIKQILETAKPYSREHFANEYIELYDKLISSK